MRLQLQLYFNNIVSVPIQIVARSVTETRGLACNQQQWQEKTSLYQVKTHSYGGIGLMARRRRTGHFQRCLLFMESIESFCEVCTAGEIEGSWI